MCSCHGGTGGYLAFSYTEGGQIFHGDGYKDVDDDEEEEEGNIPTLGDQNDLNLIEINLI